MKNFPHTLFNYNLDFFFQTLNELRVCCGNQDFPGLILQKNSFCKNFSNKSGEDVAFVETLSGSKVNDFSTIRHINCDLIVNTEHLRCQICSGYRSTLRAMEYRRKSSEGNELNMFSNDRYLTPLESFEKLKKLENEKSKLTSKIFFLREKIKQIIQKEGVTVDNSVDEMLKEVICKEQSNPFEENSPQFLLWEQQKKQGQVNDNRGMRWHPLIIRWCLSLYLKSPSTYKQLRSNSFLMLPCKNTILKYVNFTDPGCGFNKDILEQLVKALDYSNLADYQKNVSLVFDEMKIKSGLVFCSSTGKLIGFTDLNDTGTLIQEFHQQLLDKSENCSLAKYVIVYMVRGIFMNFCFAFGHFASEGFSSEYLYHTTWEAIEILESLNLRVRTIVSDGASPNRKFYKLHQLSNGQNSTKQGFIYWTWNEYCPGKFYSFS